MLYSKSKCIGPGCTGWTSPPASVMSMFHHILQSLSQEAISVISFLRLGHKGSTLFCFMGGWLGAAHRTARPRGPELQPFSPRCFVSIPGADRHGVGLHPLLGVCSTRNNLTFSTLGGEASLLCQTPICLGTTRLSTGQRRCRSLRRSLNAEARPCQK